jgi:hypothetical protein
VSVSPCFTWRGPKVRGQLCPCEATTRIQSNHYFPSPKQPMCAESIRLAVLMIYADS